MIKKAKSASKKKPPEQKRSAPEKKKRYLPVLGLLTLCALVVGYLFYRSTEQEPPAAASFVRVEGSRFVIGDTPYVFAGVNFWQGMYLAADVVDGGRARLVRELDRMKQYGITNLRIMGAVETSSITDSLRPTIMERPGVYNERLLKGLDLLLAEMSKREMRAVVAMGNYWEWTGGMAQLKAWAGGEQPKDPKKDPVVQFMSYAAEFYSDARAQAIYSDYLKHVITRTNTVTGRRYADDPTIMAWEPANEPRPHPMGRRKPELVKDYIEWMDQTAKQIHKLAPHQLVTTGNEGTMGSLKSLEIYEATHRLQSVDYMTFHLWPKNWRWYVPGDSQKTLSATLERTRSYFDFHAASASRLNKPTVLEEFDIPRDDAKVSPTSSVAVRDEFLGVIYGLVEKSVAAKGPVAGTNVWAWGGEGRAHSPDAKWIAGTDFTGDPPQERQGLNSIFDSDRSTLNLIRAHAETLQRTAEKRMD